MQFWRRLFGKVDSLSDESSNASLFQSPARAAPPPPPPAPPPLGRVPPLLAREVDWSPYFGAPAGDPSGSLPVYFVPGKPSFLGNGGRISPNRRFAVAWGIPGFVAFMDAKVTFQQSLANIIDGGVSDTGACIMGTGSAGQKRLHGKLQIFDSNHTLILEDSYGAMVFNVAISPDGHFAVCQTCNGNVRGGLLSVYDLESRSRLRQEETGSHWASSYAFDSQEAVLTLRFRDGADERIALDGRQISRYAEPDRPSGPSPCSANPYDDFWAAEGAFLKLPDDGTVSQDVLIVIRDGFRRALTGDMTDRKRAEAYRRLGEIALRMDDPSLAIKCWKSAVAWLPGIGVVKKLKALERLHPSPSPSQK